jgi:hypothetical protein
MACPTRTFRFFTDASGVRWGVETRVLGEGVDAIPVGFTFMSERGEHRRIAGSPPEGLSWDQFSDADWCELLVAAPEPHSTARRHRRRPTSFAV